MMSASLWFALLIVFAQAESVVIGMALLMITGFLQSLCMVPMSVLLRINAAGFAGGSGGTYQPRRYRWNNLRVTARNAESARMPKTAIPAIPTNIPSVESWRRLLRIS
jgi:hypothetical protein